MTFYAATDQAVLEELGRRLRQRRLDSNLSQAEVAERAGLDRTTIGQLERDGRASLLTMVQVLRALGALDEIDAFLPPLGPSPLELARRQGRVRQRASRPRQAGDETSDEAGEETGDNGGTMSDDDTDHGET
jgi:transcriptional regulator with XRE-family HTH domain